MKFNLSSVTMAAMAFGVAARPGANGLSGNSMDVRHERVGAVGELFSRGKQPYHESYFNVNQPGGTGETETGGTGSGTGSQPPTPTGGGGGGSTGKPTPTSTGTGTGGGGKMPASAGNVVLDTTQTIASGETFDGGMKTYDRGVECTGQAEGGDSDSVFNIMEGGSLSNVIIGPNQREGVHCQGSCTLTNVWWAAVCEDAFTIKAQAAGATTTINGGGAFGATDKVFQHNAGGTLEIIGFDCEDFSKMYRSCGNCDTSEARHVIITDCTAVNGDLIAGINTNFGDTATITSLEATGVEAVCERFEGVEQGSEPSSIGVGGEGCEVS